MLKLKKLSKRDRRIMVVLGVVGSVVTIVFGLFLPFYDAQTQLGEKIQGEQKFLKRYTEIIRSKGLYESRLEKLERILRQHRGMLLDATDSSVGTIQLEEVVRDLAAKHKVQVARSTPLRERKIGDRYTKITLQINLQTNMVQLTQFLHALSIHPKLFLVEDFFLSSSRTRKNGRIKPRMNISSFISLPQKISMDS